MGLLDWLRRKEPGSGPPYTTNEAWLEALRSPHQEEALGELRTILVRGLRAVLAKRVPGHAEAMAEDVAQEALLKILDRLDTFRGESQFTTWAQKVAVNLALSRLRRKRWENVSLGDLTPADDHRPPAALSDPDYSPEDQTAQHLLVERVTRIVEEQLTERQRTAITAVMMHGMPIEEVARRMDTNRNALYKLIYDARQRLKQELENQGLSSDAILAELDDR